MASGQELEQAPPPGLHRFQPHTCPFDMALILLGKIVEGGDDRVHRRLTQAAEECR